MSINNLFCLKCNINLENTKLKRYCRECINTIKNDRQDMQDTNKCRCNKCRCYKPNEEFKNILKNCKACRTRREHRTNKDNNNTDINDGLEEDKDNKNIKKSITKVNYKSKLENILTYLKDKYKITETLEQLEDINNNLLEETEEEAEEQETDEEQPDDPQEQLDEDRLRQEGRKD